jgi:ABC-type enterochelin transport system ATPase subunit
VNGGFRIGTVDEIMTVPVLSEMYRIPVDVDNLNGHRVVVARRDGQTLPVSDV